MGFFILGQWGKWSALGFKKHTSLQGYQCMENPMRDIGHHRIALRLKECLFFYRSIVIKYDQAHLPSYDG